MCEEEIKTQLFEHNMFVNSFPPGCDAVTDNTCHMEHMMSTLAEENMPYLVLSNVY